MAMEMPFLIVGGVLAGGFGGWLLDRWLHTSPWLMIVLGSVGFAAGLRDVLKRAERDARDNERPK
jgi:ATP synthase protein I